MQTTPEEWAEVHAINAETTVFCCQAFIRHLLAADRPGTVGNVSSLAGRSGGVHNGMHYASSKAAILAFTRGLGRALGTHGIRGNAVAPGIIDTPMSHAVPGSDALAKSAPIPRRGTVDEVADSIAFLAGSGSSCITGATLDVNGGLI
jgi:3-oxoacyl-[acyl-carrier protein] reductase